MTELIPAQLDRHRDEAMANTAAALAWAEHTLRGWQERTEPFRDRAITALWAVNHIGEALIVTPQGLRRLQAAMLPRRNAS